MTTHALKQAFDAARQQGVVMSLAPGGQVTMMGPREAVRTLNAAIRGHEDLFITLLCEYLGEPARASLAQSPGSSDDERAAQLSAWHTAAHCLHQVAAPAA